MRLVYVLDAYCGWSYGFAATLSELVLRQPDLQVDVVSGGLFTGFPPGTDREVRIHLRRQRQDHRVDRGRVRAWFRAANR